MNLASGKVRAALVIGDQKTFDELCGVAMNKLIVDK